jgi:hypothetical protein
LFALSIALRQPLFNKDFATNWESLSAHVLVTSKAWYQSSPSIHHFNLLFNFSRPEDKFIDNLGTSGVADKFGNYYYISMPHLAYIVPYLFFVATRQAPTIPGLEIFALLVHFIICVLLYVLTREMTKTSPGSQLASLAAVAVFLFAPQALFYYQNGVVGSMMVLPFTVGLLLAVSALLSDDKSKARSALAWVSLGLCIVLGCLTDWHGYFTAFATAVVFLFLAFKGIVRRSTGMKVAALCGVCVVLAIAIFCWQNSRIAGFDAFFHAVFGRLKERVGKSSNGLGLNTFGYYESLARFYAGYLPFLLVIACLLALSIRTKGAQLLRTRFGLAVIPLIISTLAVVLDHLALANHTAAHCFTTLNDLVPIALLMAFSVAWFLETRGNGVRAAVLVCSLLAGCMIAGTATYYAAYLHRPRPYRTAASSILSVARPLDVMFTTSGTVPSRSILYYVGRNFQVVRDEADAAEYLSCHQFQHGTLVNISDNWTVEESEVLPSRSGCPAASPADRQSTVAAR